MEISWKDSLKQKKWNHLKEKLHFKVNPDETLGSCVLYLYSLGTADDCRQWLLPRWHRDDGFSLTRNKQAMHLPLLFCQVLDWAQYLEAAEPFRSVHQRRPSWPQCDTGKSSQLAGEWCPAGCGPSRRGECLGEACPLVRRIRTEQHPNWQSFGNQPCCPALQFPHWCWSGSVCWVEITDPSSGRSCHAHEWSYLPLCV